MLVAGLPMRSVPVDGVWRSVEPKLAGAFSWNWVGLWSSMGSRVSFHELFPVTLY